MSIEEYKLSVKKEDTKGLIFHHSEKEIGERYVFCDSELYLNSNLYTILRKFDEVENENCSIEYIEYHMHTKDSLFIFIGSGKNLDGLKVRVCIEDKCEDVDSPISIYIPAGKKHKYCPLKGSGFFMNIVISDGLSYNEVTYKENRK